MMKTSEFDQKAKDWDTPDKIKRSEAIAQVIRGRVKLSESKSALEYGCGTGLLSFALKQDLKNVTLADKSEGMLAVLKNKIKIAGIENWKVEDLDLLTDETPKERYDLIYTQLTLHHILDTKGILEKFYQILQPGGHLCIADLDQEDGSFHGMEITNVHRGYDRKDLCELAKNVGFKTATTVDAYQLEHEINDKGDKKVFSMFLMTAFK